MQVFRNILVPTDFEGSALRALELALQLAPLGGAKVHVLHVIMPPPSAYALYAEGLSWPVAEMNAHATTLLDQMVATARTGYADVHAVLKQGAPWEMILEASRECAADLIVMGTHGRHGVKRLLLGSVAEKIVRTALVPVLTVPSRRDTGLA